MKRVIVVVRSAGERTGVIDIVGDMVRADSFKEQI